jgi:predicted permease
VLQELGELYVPFVGWTLLGFLFLRRIPPAIPDTMIRGLYWIGVPVQVLAFTLRADWRNRLGWVPLIVVVSLLIAWLFAQLVCRLLPVSPDQRGSFLLSATIGNTGFVGLALTPYLLAEEYLAWVVLYSLTHNVIGSYGFGVAIASFYGKSEHQKKLWDHGREILFTPAIWAFVLGCIWKYAPWERGWGALVTTDLQIIANWIPPIAFVLVGMRLQMQEAENLRVSLPAGVWAAVIKILALPFALGLMLQFANLPKDAVLGMVLEAGMPTAVAGMILADTYRVPQSQIIPLSIAFSSVGLLFTIPVWLWYFG